MISPPQFKVLNVYFHVVNCTCTSKIAVQFVLVHYVLPQQHYKL